MVVSPQLFQTFIGVREECSTLNLNPWCVSSSSEIFTSARWKFASYIFTGSKGFRHAHHLQSRSAVTDCNFKSERAMILLSGTAGPCFTPFARIYWYTLHKNCKQVSSIWTSHNALFPAMHFSHESSKYPRATFSEVYAVKYYPFWRLVIYTYLRTQWVSRW